MSALWLPVVAVGAVAVVSRWVGGSLLTPTAFLPTYWFALLAIAVLLNGQAPVHPVGLWVIVSIVTAFCCGGLLFDASVRRAQVDRIGERAASPSPLELAGRLRWFTALFTAVAATGVVALVVTGIERFGLTFSPDALLRLGGRYSLARYTLQQGPPPSVAVLTYFIFPAVVLGGQLFALAASRRTRLFALAPLAVVALTGFTTAVRSGALLAAVMWLGAYLAMRVSRSRGQERLLTSRRLLVAVMGGLTLIGFSSVLLWVRGGAVSTADPVHLATRSLSAFFGSLAAFSEWVASGAPTQRALGAFTFAGLFDRMGLAERHQGLYSTFVSFPSGLGSNIYTAFRGLLDDFGLVGTWLLSAVGGASGSLMYHRCAAGHFTWAGPLAVLYAAILYSHLYSMFIFNSVVVGWVVAIAVILWPVAHPMPRRSRLDSRAVETA